MVIIVCLIFFFCFYNNISYYRYNIKIKCYISFELGRNNFRVVNRFGFWSKRFGVSMIFCVCGIVGKRLLLERLFLCFMVGKYGLVCNKEIVK